MNSTFTPTVRQAFDPLLLDVLNWGPLDDAVGRDPALRESLKEAVDELPEMQRLIVEGLFWEQVPRRALARRLGISRATVTTLLQKALETLNENLHAQD